MYSINIELIVHTSIITDSKRTIQHSICPLAISHPFGPFNHSSLMEKKIKHFHLGLAYDGSRKANVMDL
jgi:hypothetical protein